MICQVAVDEMMLKLKATGEDVKTKIGALLSGGQAKLEAKED